jgi:uncharacterized Zn finger protein (UPF0148 family)
MEGDLLKKMIIEIACPNCKTKTKIKIEDIIQGRTITCPGCQTNIKLEDKDQSLQKANIDLGNSLKKLNKTIKINFKL